MSKSEASIFLIRKWTENEGAFAKQEIEKAHSFIVSTLIQDLNSGHIPSWEGEDNVISVAEDDGRTIRMIGSGLSAGSYVSSPGNLENFTTYGNATAFANVNIEHNKKLKKTKKQSEAN